MSSFLIGYLLHGPETIDADLAANVAADFLDRQLRLTGVITTLHGPLGYDTQEEIDAALLKTLDELFPGVSTTELYQDTLEELAERLLDCSPASVVEGILSIWNTGSAEDSASRIVDMGAGTTRIFFCGGESSGDTPEGEAYQAIEFAAFAGLLRPLGIK